jgi:hypothetical protein
MTAHRCPRCKLLFAFRTELEWHLRNDHHPAVEEEVGLRVELKSAHEVDESALADLQSSPVGPAVTVLLGTVPASVMTSLDAARLRRLAHRAADRLQLEPGAPTTALRHRLARAVAAAEGAPTDHGLAILANTDHLALFRLPFDPGDRVVVDPTFAIRDLLDALQRFPPHRIVVLADPPRVLEGQQAHLAETTDTSDGTRGLSSPNPFRLEGHKWRRRRSWAWRRPRRLAIITHADELLDQRNRAVGDLPLVVVGSRRLLADFRSRSRHAAATIGEVDRTRPNAPTTVLADLARPALSHWINNQQHARLGLLGHGEGSNQVAWGLTKVWHAVQDGTAQHLWVERHYAVPAYLSADGSVIRPTQDPETPGVIDDIIDDLLQAATTAGATVDIVDDGVLEHPEPIAALQRHESPHDELNRSVALGTSTAHA